MEKEEISSRPRMFHSIFNKVNNCCALESCKATKAEISYKKINQLNKKFMLCAVSNLDHVLF